MKIAKTKQKTLTKDILINCFLLFFVSFFLISKNSETTFFKNFHVIPLSALLIAIYFFFKDHLRKTFLSITEKTKLLITLSAILIGLTIMVEYNHFRYLNMNGWQLFLIYTITIISILVLLKKLFAKKRSGSISDRKTFVLLSAIVVIGFLFRVYNLGFLPLAGDEYRHILAAKHFLTDGFFDYTDSKFTNYLVIFVAKYFSFDSIALLRLPFALIGTFSVALFFLLGKELFNKKVGLISSFLFACMPLSIGLSKYIRCYTVELFIFLLLIFILHTNKIKSYFLKLFIIPSTAFLFIVLDHGTRFMEYSKLFFAYVLIFLTLKTLSHFKKSRDIKVSSLILLFVIGAFYLSLKNNVHFENFEIESRFLFLFNAYNSNTTWFPIFLPSFVIFSTLLSPLATKLNTKEEDSLLALLFAISFSVFSFIFILDLPRSFQSRYFYHALPFFILPFALGIYTVLSNLDKKSLFSKILYTTILIALLLAPTKSVLLSKQEGSGEVDKKTGLTHYNTVGVYKFLEDNQVSAEQLIVTSPWVFDFYFNQPFLKESEKEFFVKFPQRQSYEFRDRTKMFSVAGSRSDQSIEQIKTLIKENHQLKYLIAHTPLTYTEKNFQPEFVISKIKELELMEVIDSDKSFGFYVYKIN